MGSEPNEFHDLFSPVDWIKVLHLSSLYGFDAANLDTDRPITAADISAK